MSEDRAIAQTLFAAWLAEQQPQLFNALAQAAGAQTGAPMKLSGFTDFLSSIGSGISSAAKTVVNTLSSTVQSVGSFLNSSGGQNTLSQLASVYAGTQAGNALSAQMQLANAGQAPAPINMVWDAANQRYVAVDQGNTMLGAAQLNQMRPSFFAQYGLWVAGGGLALLAVILLSRKR